MRPVVDRMCRLTDWVALATQLEWELQRGLDSETGPALELYRMLVLEQVDIQDTPELADLEGRLITAT